MSPVFPSKSSQWLPILGLDYAHSRGARSHLLLEYSSHITDFTDFSSHITSHSSMCMLSIAVLDFVEKSSFPGFATLKVYYSSG